jgi:hypothetical protein
MLEPKSEQSSSKKRRVCDVGVKERLATSLPGLPLPTDSVFGVLAYSRSETDAGPASNDWGDLSDVDGMTESLDLGASRRKLQSNPFLSQFAHDGCLMSHYFHC